MESIIQRKFTFKGNNKRVKLPETFTQLDIEVREAFEIQQDTFLCYNYKDNEQLTTIEGDESYSQYLSCSNASTTQVSVKVPEPIPVVSSLPLLGTLIKVSFQQKTYKIMVPKSNRLEEFLEEFAFRIDKKATFFQLRYSDEDGDVIAVDFQKDFEIYISQYKSVPLKIEIEANNKEPQQQNPHKQVKEQKELSIVYEQDFNQNIQGINDRDKKDNMYEESKNMPNCAQKYLHALIYHLDVNPTLDNYEGKKSPDDSIVNEQIRKNLEELKRCIQQEELNDDHINKHLKQAEIKVENKYWVGAASNTAAKIIKDQNIIMLIGKTGTGKSSLTHYLAGSIMELTRINGIDHIEPINYTSNELLKQVKTGHSTESVTKLISPVYIDCNAINGSIRTDTIIVCDCPGFEDTCGPEADIANGIGVIQAIQGCESVRPVFLLSSLSQGDRLTGLKDQACNLMKMSKNPINLVESLNYVFTKYSEDGKRQILPLLKEFQKQNQNNEMIANFFNSMVQKVEKSGVNCVNLMNKNPGILLDQLAQATPLTNPKRNFSSYITDKARIAIEKQANSSQKAVRVQSKKSKDPNYFLVLYKLDQLQFLVGNIDEQNVKMIYNDTIKELQEYIEQNTNNEIQKFNEKISFNNQEFSKSDIESYQSLIEIYQNNKYVQDIRKIHFKSNQPMTIFDENLIQQVEILQKAAKDKKINDILQRVTLDKLKILSEHFTVIQDSYQKYRSYFDGRMNGCWEQFQQFLKDLKFKQCANILDIFLDLAQSLYQHFDQVDLFKQCEQSKQTLINFLLSLTGKLENIINIGTANDNDINDIKKFVEIIELIDIDFGVVFKQKHNLIDIIQGIKMGFYGNISNYFQLIQNKIDVLYNDQQQKSIRLIEPFFDQLAKIYQINGLQHVVASQYYNILQKICGLVSELKNKAEQLINEMDGKSVILNAQKLKIYLHGLRDSQWLDRYRDNYTQDIINHIEGETFKILQQLFNQAKIIELDLESYEQLDEFYKIVVNASKLKEICSNDGKLVEQIYELFQVQKDTIFTLIDKEFDQDEKKDYKLRNINSKKISNAVRYLRFFNDIKEQKAKCHELIQKLQGFYNDLLALVQGDFRNCYEQITSYDGQEYQQNENPLKKNIFNKFNFWQIIDNLQVDFKELSQNDQFVGSQHILITIEDMKRQFNDDFDLIQTDIMLNIQEGENNTINFRALNTKLQISKTLSQLDVFINIKKFEEIYQSYKSFRFQGADQELRDMVLKIDKSQYGEILMDMQSLLKNQKDYICTANLQKLKIYLNSSVENLIQDTKQQVNFSEIFSQLSIDKIKKLSEKLQKIKNAQIIEQFLDENIELEENFEQFIESIEQNIILMHKKIQNLFERMKYKEAEIELQNVLVLQNELANFITEEVIQSYKGLKQYKIKCLDQKVDNFDIVEIENYFLNQPIEIISRFQEALLYNQDYEDYAIKLENNIINKLNDKLQEIKTKNYVYEKEREISNLKDIFPYLSDKLLIIFKKEVKKIIDQLEQLQQSNQYNLQQALSNLDVEALEQLLGNYKENSKYYRNEIEQIKQTIKKQIDMLNQDFIESLNSLNLQKSFELLKELIKYENLFGLSFQVLRNSFNFAKCQLKINFEQNIDILEDFFEKLNLNQYIEDQENNPQEPHRQNNFLINMNMPQYMDIGMQSQNDFKQKKTREALVSLFAFAKYNSQNGDYFENIIHGFNYKINRLIHLISKFFDNCQHQFEELLHKLDSIGLAKILSKMKKTTEIYNFVTQQKDIQAQPHFIQNLINELNTQNSYQQMINTLEQTIIQSRQLIVDKNLINKDTKGFKYSREDYYIKFNQSLQFLKNIKTFSSHNFEEINVQTLYEECTKIFSINVVNMLKIAIDKLSVQSPSNQDYQQSNIIIYNLKTIGKIVSYIKDTVKLQLEELNRTVNERIQKIACQDQDNSNFIQDFTTKLIQLKHISLNLTVYKKMIYKIIDDMLETFIQVQNSTSLVKVRGLLQNSKNIGRQILQDHQIFEGYQVSIFQQNIQRKDVDSILGSIKGNNINLDTLKLRFIQFDELNRKLIEENLRGLNCENLIINIKSIASKINYAGQVNQVSHLNSARNDQLSQNKINQEWKDSEIQLIISLMSHLFALWTIKNAKQYFSAQSQDIQNDQLYMPTPAQIISIFMILGIASDDQIFQRILVEIKTGEGKSLTLAISASILALLNYEVSCACYSKYLSDRDYLAFNDFYALIGIQKQIKYGTFNSLCENLINEKIQIRSVITDLITNKSISKAKSDDNISAKVLLIDEVDVFFSKDFYGSIYLPAGSLQDSTITAFILYLWNTKDQDLSYNEILLSQEYLACYQNPLFKGWEFLIQEAAKSMLYDLRNFETHQYIVKDQKIGYKQQDGIEFNIMHGYYTLFAYLLEKERNQVSQMQLDKFMSIEVKCGYYSFAEILHKYDLILGVTGTLKTLGDIEKKIITEEYKIKNYLYIPSVYGVNKIVFQGKYDIDIKIRSKENFYSTLNTEINNKLRGITQGTKRAVIVFFETKVEIQEFINAISLLEYQILDERLNEREKKQVITNASTSGQITLATREYGRGTDFKSIDEIVNSNAGVHVIQTFLSEEKSEEAQIMGRTARQGEAGSYSMVLLLEILEKFDIKTEDIESHQQDLYEMMDLKRTQFFNNKYQNHMEFVKKAKLDHAKASDFLDSIIKGQIEESKVYLHEINAGPNPDTNHVRTIFLMDATGSMSEVLQKAKNTVQTMFERVSRILKDQGVLADCFQIQFAAYRKYSSGKDLILQHSRWTSKPQLLSDFISKIEPLGGQGNEAIEIGLWHANREHFKNKISQVVLIGDMPANTEDEVTTKRKNKIWDQSLYAEPTYYKTELQKLIQSGIPVHAFYVHSRAKENFKSIAEESKGSCEFLDISKEVGTEMLTNFVALEVTRKVGEQRGQGEAFAEAYRIAYMGGVNEQQVLQ